VKGRFNCQISLIVKNQEQKFKHKARQFIVLQQKMNEPNKSNVKRVTITKQRFTHPGSWLQCAQPEVKWLENHNASKHLQQLVCPQE